MLEPYELNQVITGHCLDVLAQLPAGAIHAAITSPPYYGLRDYGLPPVAWPAVTFAPMAGLPEMTVPEQVCCLGLEKDIWSYVGHLVAVFREVRRVLRDDGTLWLNLGDSYAANRAYQVSPTKWKALEFGESNATKVPDGLKPKDLMLIPARVALALQGDGWYLRSDVIWHKLNPMPESVTDRPTKAHEYVFLMSKGERYYYDAEAVKEPATDGEYRTRGKIRPSIDAHAIAAPIKGRTKLGLSNQVGGRESRNRRTVWTVATQPYSGAKSLADYVGDDGRPYKRSEDCPIHGRLRGSHTPKMAGYDEQPSRPLTGKSGKSSRHGQERVVESSSIHSLGYQGLLISSDAERNPESTSESKIYDPFDRAEFQSHLDNEGRLQTLACNSDLQDQSNVEIAIENNKQAHKTAPALGTNQPYTSCEEKTFHTDGKQESPLMADLAERISESNISPDGSDDHLLAETEHHNVDKFSYGYGSVAKCTCQVITVDHFATFPPKLIEPMILASTSEYGVCGACGGPWVRVVEKVKGENGSYNGSSFQRGKSKEAREHLSIVGEQERTAASVTTGWRPSCACADAPTVPAVVLDPFGGSGTTLKVAIANRRNGIGIDANPTYATELAAERLNGTQITMGVF